MISVDDAEALTGVRQWQVSRWRTKLAKEDTYRQSIIEAAQRKAGLRDVRDNGGPVRGLARGGARSRPATGQAAGAAISGGAGFRRRGLHG